MSLNLLLEDTEKLWANVRLNDLTVDNTISAGDVAFASIETPILVVDAPSAAPYALLTCQDNLGTCAWSNTAQVSTLTAGSIVVTNDGANSVQVVGDINPALNHHSNLGGATNTFANVYTDAVTVTNSIVPAATSIDSATIGSVEAPFLALHADQVYGGFVETPSLSVDAGGTGFTCMAECAVGGDIYPLSDEHYDIGRTPGQTFRNINLGGYIRAGAAHFVDTTDQIIIQPNASGHSMFITTASPSASDTTLTIPDISATASAGQFMLTQGAGQTMTQQLTLAQPLSFLGGAQLQSVQRVALLADILAMSTIGTQFQLLPAPGAGYIVAPTLIAFNSIQPTGTTVAFAGGSSINVQYGPQVTAGTGPAVMTTFVAASVFTSGNNVWTMHPAVTATPFTSVLINQPIYMCCATAFTGGTGTITNGSMLITVHYLIVAAV
jgi:hypothetical protein